MKIRFTKTLSTARRCYRRTKVYDLDHADAQEFLVRGLAVEVTDEPQVQAEKPIEAKPEEKPKAKKKTPAKKKNQDEPKAE